MYNNISIPDMIRLIDWYFADGPGPKLIESYNVELSIEDIEDIKQQVMYEMSRTKSDTLKEYKLSTIVSRRCHWNILRKIEYDVKYKNRVKKYEENLRLEEKPAEYTVDDRAFAELPPRITAIIRHRFGLDSREPVTNKATGEAFGISRERVRQILNRYLPDIDIRYISSKT